MFSLGCLVSNGRWALLGGIRLGGSATGGIRRKWGNKGSKTFSKLKFDNLFLQKVRAFVCEVYK